MCCVGAGGHAELPADPLRLPARQEGERQPAMVVIEVVMMIVVVMVMMVLQLVVVMRIVVVL